MSTEAFDYEEYAKKIASMEGGVYNRNKFRLGTYKFELSRCVLKKSRNGAPMIAIEGTVTDVLRSTENSNGVGESVSYVNVQNQYPEYFMKDQLGIAAAVLGVSAQALKDDPEGMVKALKAVFPPEGGAKSVALGRTIQVNHTTYTKDDGTVKTATYFDAAR